MGKPIPYINDEKRRPARSSGTRRRQMKDILQPSIKMNQKLHKRPNFWVIMKKTAKK